MAGTGKRRRAARGAGQAGRGAVRRCCFAEAVGARLAGCAMARKSTRQYRRTVDCADGEAHQRCAAWLDQIRQASRFTFGTPRSPAALPRRDAVKLQCGSLIGVSELLGEPTSRRIDDVAGLMRRALNRYESFDRLPLNSVIRRVHDYETQND